MAKIIRSMQYMSGKDEVHMDAFCNNGDQTLVPQKYAWLSGM